MAFLLAAGALWSWEAFLAPFRSAPTRTATSLRAKGFDDSPKVKKSKASDDSASAPDDGTESVKLVKDERTGKSTAISTVKLNALTKKTLEERMKREEDIDLFEYSMAEIAKYGPKVAMMPVKVADRVAKRGLVGGGSFVVAVLLAFGTGVYLYKSQDIVIPGTLMAYTTLSLLALAIIGSTYGIFSASWEEDKPGTALGFKEFSTNVNALGESFRRISIQPQLEQALEQRNKQAELLEAKMEARKELEEKKRQQQLLNE